MVWFFRAAYGNTLILSLTDASTLARAPQAQQVARVCRSCLKENDPQLLGVLGGYLLSAIRATPALDAVDVWSCYPGARSASQPLEVLASFPRTFRSMIDCGPVLLRHRPCLPRHLTAQGQYDPLGQLSTLQVNPAYDLRGKSVAVLDDYLTYGVCAASAAVLLQAAGATRVACISIGKFGNVTCRYEVQILGDPQQPPVLAECKGRSPLIGQHDRRMHQKFQAILTQYL